jgi:nicotinamide/nicotinate riboside kinase
LELCRLYKPDDDIPIDEETGFANWDCEGSLDMTAFIDAMRYIRENEGQFPPTLDSKEDQNELGPSGVPDHIVQIMRESVLKQDLVKRGETDVLLCFVDGFLLYSDPDVAKELDIRLLVRAPYENLKARREARSGYVTIDGVFLSFRN